MSSLFILFVRSALLFAYLGAVVVLCAGAAVRRGDGAAGAAARILATLVAPATFLALVGLFYWPLALSGSLLAAVWQGAGSTAQLANGLRKLWRSMSLVSKVAFVCLGVACAFRAGAALSMPPIDGDSLLYHLPMSAALLQDHSMWSTRALLYPGAAELGEAIGAAATGNVNGIVAFQMTLVLALAMVGFGWARRAGASIDGAAASSIIAVALPLVIDQMFTSQNDIFVCVAIAAACILWRQSARLAALSLGLAFAAKLTSFVLVPAIAIVMISFEGWPFAFADIAWAASVAAPWYLRTWILTGTPVYAVASLGWSSTIAAQLSHTWRYLVFALRSYGGLAAVGGAIALAFIPVMRGRNAFARALPWLALVSFAAWIILPNSAESVPGTLDQIRQGWSLRYALLLPFVLATTLPIVLDRATRLPLAALVALIAATSAIVRSANLTASSQPLGFSYAVPVFVAIVLALIALLALPGFSGRGRVLIGDFVAAAAVAIMSLTMMVGAQSMRQLWSPAYLQWSPRIPMSAVVVDKRILSSSHVAVIGMRSFPLVGPMFERRLYDNIIVQSPDMWLVNLRQSGVPIVAAAGESGAPDQPGFLQPLPAEVEISHSPGVCKLAEYSYVRLYGITEAACTRAK